MIDDDITLKKLQVFMAFITLGSMSLASNELGLSIVSVHRALHSLEEALRCPLFKRSGRKLIPLASALVLAEHVKRMLDECERGIYRTRETAGFSPSALKIGGLNSLTVRTIPNVLAGLKLRRPALNIELTLGSRRVLLSKLNDGRLDAIIIPVTGLNSPELLAIPMFDDELLFATSLDSCYAGCQEIDLKAVRHEKFISLSEEFATYYDVLTAFERSGIKPNIALRVDDIFALMNLVSGGLGYALLPSRFSDVNPKVRLIPLTAGDAITQKIGVVLLRCREREPNLLALSAECRTLSRKWHAARGSQRP